MNHLLHLCRLPIVSKRVCDRRHRGAVSLPMLPSLETQRGRGRGAPSSNSFPRSTSAARESSPSIHLTHSTSVASLTWITHVWPGSIALFLPTTASPDRLAHCTYANDVEVERCEEQSRLYEDAACADCSIQSQVEVHWYAHTTTPILQRAVTRASRSSRQLAWWHSTISNNPWMIASYIIY